MKEHENGERQVSYNLTGENSLTLDEDLAGLDLSLIHILKMYFSQK